MSFMKMKKALENISSRRKKSTNGKEYDLWEVYVGTDPISGKPVRISASSKERVENAVRDFYRRSKASGAAGAALTPSQAMDALNAILALDKEGLRMSLTECALKTIEDTKKASVKRVEKSLADAYAEYLEEYTEGTINRKTIESRVGKWVLLSKPERPISSLTEAEILEYLSKFTNEKTWNNSFCYIKSFFQWCAAKRRNYLAENPLDGIKKKIVVWKRPEYMTAEDTEKYFRVLQGDKDHPECLAYSVVSFFCGVRREEILRGASDSNAVIFDIPNKTLMIVKVKQWTLGAHPRSFTIPENALAWMQSFNFTEAWRKITTATVHNIARIAERNGIKLPRNAGRHSFITHHIAAYDSVDKTCKMAGTSPEMARNNYSGLGNQPDGLRYFSIMP